mgnify:CR=1 FL=1
MYVFYYISTAIVIFALLYNFFKWRDSFDLDIGASNGEVLVSLFVVSSLWIITIPIFLISLPFVSIIFLVMSIIDKRRR